MKIAFLGLGAMGVPMVRSLLAAGHDVTVWNRTAERAKTLAAERVGVAPTAAEAVRDQAIVLTSLFDDAAHEDVLFRSGGVIEALKPGALHISLSTIGVALSEKLAEEHAKRGQLYVAAPVFGRPNLAEEGRLWIVLAGESQAVSMARLLLEPLARGFSLVGHEPRQAHALKLGGNFLIGAMIHSLGEAFVYSESQGIPAEIFLEVVNSALFQSSFYAAYGKVMLHPPQTPGATVALGEKDLRLFREASASRHSHSSLADSLARIFAEAQDAGLGNEDWAVGQYRMAQRRGPTA